MDANEQNSIHSDIILLPESMFGYVPCSSVTPNHKMAEQEDDSGKKWWNDDNTKLLISEFRNYYEQWRNGRINKKKTMWQKVADALKNKGFDCKAEQVENRYKTLLRGYRKSCGILPRATGRKRAFKYENELSDIFMNDAALRQEDPISDDNSTNFIIDQDSADGEEDDSNDNITHFEEVNLEEPYIPSNSYYSRKPAPRVKFKKVPIRKKQAKSSADVLIEIKELMKKVELRRQIRHEQNLKVAIERNEILKRKNELMEQMLRNN